MNKLICLALILLAAAAVAQQPPAKPDDLCRDIIGERLIRRAG
jgi:hypothetical protein